MRLPSSLPVYAASTPVPCWLIPAMLTPPASKRSTVIWFPANTELFGSHDQLKQLSFGEPRSSSFVWHTFITAGIREDSLVKSAASATNNPAHLPSCLISFPPAEVLLTTEP